MALSRQYARFCEELVINGGSAARAWRRSRPGCSAANQTVYNEVNRALKKPEVKAYIAELEEIRRQRMEHESDRVAAELWSIALADPNELVEHRRVACRYCFGKKHHYQWTARELREAESARARKAKREPNADLPELDRDGGTGYNPTKDPNPKCPECFGEGIGRVFVHDTRFASGDARRLLAGVKVTKEGIEIKMHDQKGALELLGRHKGMFKDQVDVNVTELTDAERVAKLAALADAARARRAGQPPQ